MIGFRLSLVLDLGLGTEASRASNHRRDGSAANIDTVAKTGLGLSPSSSRASLKPLPAGPLEPERRLCAISPTPYRRGEE
jgi:hypothetical protein